MTQREHRDILFKYESIKANKFNMHLCQHKRFIAEIILTIPLPFGQLLGWSRHCMPFFIHSLLCTLRKEINWLKVLPPWDDFTLWGKGGWGNQNTWEKSPDDQSCELQRMSRDEIWTQEPLTAVMACEWLTKTFPGSPEYMVAEQW